MSKTNVIKLLVLGTIVGVTVFLAIHSRRPEAVRPGTTAPDFTMPTLRGEPLRLRDFRGQVVVLNFWATWCPPCVEEMPSLQKFADDMIGKGVAVISVSVDTDQNALEEFAIKYRLTFPVGRDPDQAVARRYGTSKYPETYILDEEGRVAEKLIGAVNWQDARIMNRIRSLAQSGGTNGR